VEEAWFSKQDAERIRKAVRIVESLQLQNNSRRSRRSGLIPVQLTENLNSDNHATAKVLLSQEEADPDAEDATFELNVVSDEEVTIYPGLEFPNDKQLSAGRRAWCEVWDGHLHAVVFYCLDERD